MAKRDIYRLLWVKPEVERYTEIDYAEDHYFPHMSDHRIEDCRIVGYTAVIQKLSVDEQDTLQKFSDYREALSKVPTPSKVMETWNPPVLEKSRETFIIGETLGEFEISEAEYNLIKKEYSDGVLISLNGNSITGTVFVSTKEEIKAFVLWDQLRSYYHPREIYTLGEEDKCTPEQMDLIKDLLESL